MDAPLEKSPQVSEGTPSLSQCKQSAEDQKYGVRAWRAYSQSHLPVWEVPPTLAVREGTAISILEVFRIGLEIMGETWTEGLPLPSSMPWANYVTSPDLSLFSKTG